MMEILSVNRVVKEKVEQECNQVLSRSPRRASRMEPGRRPRWMK